MQGQQALLTGPSLTQSANAGPGSFAFGPNLMCLDYTTKCALDLSSAHYNTDFGALSQPLYPLIAEAKVCR